MTRCRYDVVDGDCLVTGEEISIENSGLKGVNVEPKTFSDLFSSFGDIDHNFFLSGKDAKTATTGDDFDTKSSRLMGTGESMSLAATASHPSTGIRLRVHTNQPCIQLYTGNFLTSTMLSFGKNCTHHGAFCLETQVPPNSINRTDYARSSVLSPGQKYRNLTSFSFDLQ